MCVCWGGGGGQTELGQAERERARQTDRQTDRQIETDRQTEQDSSSEYYALELCRPVSI